MENNFEKDLQNVLEDPEMGHELGPDELAIHSAGLKHPDEMDLENILAEDWDSVPEHETQDQIAESMLYEEDAQVFVPAEAEETPAYFTDAPTQVIPVHQWEEEEAPIMEASQEDDMEYTEEEEYEEDMAPKTPVRKGRPKRKKGYGLLGIPHMISTVIWLAITLAIGVSLGRVLWVCCADVMSFGKPAVTAYITVTEQDDIESVSQKLADANLIRYPGLFQKFAEITKKADRINTGTYELGSHLDYNAMINNMVYVSLSREIVTIVFPEGYNCAQFFRILEENEVCSAAELEEWAANGELKEYWFLEGVQRGDKYCLEGYLSPDTYEFYTHEEPRVVLEKFLNAFDARFTDIMKDDLITIQERYANMLASGGFSSEYIEANPLTLHQVLTVASIVERETSGEEESFDIAAVLYNRVTNPDILTMGSDATVYYAVGDFLREKTELTEEDLNSDSPYNTRKAQGIPPGPICNPGNFPLYAALDPNDNNYHYFVYDLENDKHLFSETYNEHLRKVEELGA